MFLQRSWNTGCSTRPLATVTRSCLSNLGSMRRLKTRLGGKHEENPNETVSLCLFPCRAVWIPKISPTKKMFKRRQQNQVLSWYLSSFFFLKKALYLALGSDKLWQTCGTVCEPEAKANARPPVQPVRRNKQTVCSFFQGWSSNKYVMDIKIYVYKWIRLRLQFCAFYALYHLILGTPQTIIPCVSPFGTETRVGSLLSSHLPGRRLDGFIVTMDLFR